MRILGDFLMFLQLEPNCPSQRNHRLASIFFMFIKPKNKDNYV